MFSDSATRLAVGLVLFGLVVTGGGFMLILDGITGYTNEQSDLTNSEKTTGVIKETKLEQTEPGGEDSVPKYAPRITYTYTYRGKTYTSTSVYPGPDEIKDLGAARNILEAYESKQNATVYVNSKTPERAYLQEHPGGWGRHVKPNILGIFLLVSGLWLLSLPARAVYKQYRETEPTG